jgi:hypothetical protein
MGKVLKFPKAKEARGAMRTAARRRHALLLQCRGRGKAVLFKLGKRFGLPGPMSRIETRDMRTGKKIVVQVGPVFTRLTFDGHDYFYDRKGIEHPSGSTVHRLPVRPAASSMETRAANADAMWWALDKVYASGIRKFVLKNVNSAPLYLTWAL